MAPRYETVEQKIDQIEAEMKRIGMWRKAPLPPEVYESKRAFGLDTMPFSFWLQFVFIPRVREILAEKGQFPKQSTVGTQAIREFDGQDEAASLVSMLCEFDALFD